MGVREWIGDGIISVYVRLGHRVFSQGVIEDSLDIATVDVVESEQRKGHFTRFLDLAERLNPWPILYIENVHNSVLLPVINRTGFLPHPHLPLCFYKVNANTAEQPVSILNKKTTGPSEDQVMANKLMIESFLKSLDASTEVDPIMALAEAGAKALGSDGTPGGALEALAIGPEDGSIVFSHCRDKEELLAYLRPRLLDK